MRCVDYKGVATTTRLWTRLMPVGEVQTFKERAAEIADHAHNPRGALGEAQDFLRGLDEMERQCGYLDI